MAATTSSRCSWCGWKTAAAARWRASSRSSPSRRCRAPARRAIRSRWGIQADVAGKTGTTQDNSDGWFILMHPQLVAGAWVGFNDNRVTMRSNYWGQGGHNAVLLVGDFFQAALDMRLIDSSARFPYARPGDSILEPYLDAVKEWFFGPVLDWLFGDKSKPLPRRDLEREVPRSED